MKRRSEPDGMYTRELVELEPGDTEADVQAVVPMTARGRLRQIAAEAERILADVDAQAEHERDADKLAHLERRKRDLRGLRQLCAIAESALDDGDTERAAWWCLNAGLQAHKALSARAVELDALCGLNVKSGGTEGSKRAHADKRAAWGYYQETLDKVREENPHYKQGAAWDEAGKLHGVSGRTIQRRTTWKE